MIAANIRAKLVVVFLLVGLVPMMIVSILSINTMKGEIQNDVSNSILLLAEAKEGQVYAYLDSIEGMTIDFASDGFISDKLKEIANTGSAQAVEDLNTHLIVNKKSLDETIAGILIMDTNGTVVASTHEQEMGKDESGDIYFREGKKGVFSIELREHQHYGLDNPFVVTAPLNDRKTGELLGVIVNVFDIDKMYRILSGKFQIEKGAPTAKRSETETLEVYLVNREKIMFVHPQRIGSNAADKHVAGMLIDTFPVQKCLESGEEITDVYTNYAGKEVIGASMCFSDKKWVLLSEITTEEAFSSIDRILFWIGVVTILSTLAVIIVALKLSKTITKPIRKLRDATRKIGKGNLDAKIKINSKDEIGELSHAFKEMVTDLKSSRREIKKREQELEKRVDERTKDLDKKVEELTNTKAAIMNMMDDMEATNRELIITKKKLEGSMLELKDMDVKKDQFISIAAHELKTPLTSIHGFSQLLMKKNVAKDDKKRNKFLKIVEHETERLTSLVNDILDLSRIDLGTLKFSITKVDLNDIVDTVKGEMSIPITDKGLRFSATIERLPIVMADKEKVMQILINLLNNAIKYTPKGSISLSALKEEDVIHFIVKDTGIGIPNRYKEKIFDRFYQIDSSYTRRTGGTGLGLSLVKEFVTKMGGRVWVESEPEKGSEFHFTLPVRGR